MRIVSFHPAAFDELVKWNTEDPKLFARILELIHDIRRSPFSGIGKPEPLRHQLQGYWSRRIDKEHRYPLNKLP